MTVELLGDFSCVLVSTIVDVLNLLNLFQLVKFQLLSVTFIMTGDGLPGKKLLFRSLLSPDV